MEFVACVCTTRKMCHLRMSTCPLVFRSFVAQVSPSPTRLTSTSEGSCHWLVPVHADKMTRPSQHSRAAFIPNKFISCTAMWLFRTLRTGRVLARRSFFNLTTRDTIRAHYSLQFSNVAMLLSPLCLNFTTLWAHGFRK